MSFDFPRHPGRSATAGKIAVSAIALGVVLATTSADARDPGVPLSAPFDRTAAPLSAAAHGDGVAVPAGDYTIGARGAGRSASPPHTVRLEAFRIDRHEVTNAQFAEFLNALDIRPVRDAPASRVRAGDLGEDAPLLVEGAEGSGLYPLIALDDDQARIAIVAGRFAAAPGYEDHPVAETTWRGARDYCLWRGGRLPTEAEWEAAARFGTSRLYPWGDEPPSPQRVYAGFRSGETAPVGSRPAGATPEGIFDLSGAMAEWTSSLVRPYPYDATDGREDQLAPGERITRGGDYRYDTAPSRLTAVFRDGFSRAPERGHRHIGFRCVSDAG